MRDLKTRVAEQNGKKNAAARKVIEAQRAVEQIQHQQRGGEPALILTLFRSSAKILHMMQHKSRSFCQNKSHYTYLV